MGYRGQEELDSLLETIEDLLNQAKAYGQILPRNNFEAIAAVYALKELGERVKSEALGLKVAIAELCETHNLTSREMEVLKLVAKGLANKELSYQLAISERTVQFHLKSIFTKTNTSSRTEAVANAMKKGWFLL